MEINQVFFAIPFNGKSSSQKVLITHR